FPVDGERQSENRVRRISECNSSGGRSSPSQGLPPGHLASRPADSVTAPSLHLPAAVGWNWLGESNRPTREPLNRTCQGIHEGADLQKTSRPCRSSGRRAI